MPAQLCSCEFCEIVKNIIDHLRCLLRHKMQNIKTPYDSYMQWAQCWMVSIVCDATGFYQLQKRIWNLVENRR